MTPLASGSLIVLFMAGVAASLRWNWWRPAKSGIPVLMYHKIGVPPSGSKLESLWVSRERFTWQMRWLKDHGFTAVTFADLARGVQAVKPVIITFDDGYKNQYSEGFTILRSLDMKGVFYIVTDTLGKENLWHDPESETLLPMMQESEVRAIAQNGHEIGSHTLSHQRMESLTPEQVVKQLTESK
ncbi:MAG: polysaccharide deacetylase family protein, partial [Elusimicrobiota bacterium]